MSKQFNVGLIGYGMAGQVFHAPMITSISGFNLKSIRETKEPNIELANLRYPDAAIVSTSEEIFNDPEIDLVVLATPNTAHYSLAREGLLMGKNVVVDKPFTITYEEAVDLIQLAKSRGKMISVFQNRRWDSDYLTVKKLLAAETLGDIAEVEIHFDRFRPNLKGNAWREEKLPGSGVLYDLGAHLIDQSLQLFGEPTELHADVRAQRKEAIVDDYFQVDLFYKGFKVILKAGVLVKELGPHFILHGTKGSFIKYGLDVQETALKEGKTPNQEPEWGREPESLQGKLNLDDNGEDKISRIKSETGDYRKFYQNIHDHLEVGAELAVKPEEAAQVIRIIEMCFKSSAEGIRIEL